MVFGRYEKFIVQNVLPEGQFQLVNGLILFLDLKFFCHSFFSTFEKIVVYDIFSIKILCGGRLISNNYLILNVL